MKGGEAFERDRVGVAELDGLLVRAYGLLSSRDVEPFVARADRDPHASVRGAEARRLLEVVKREVRLLQELVRLAEAVPRAEVRRVDVHGAAVRVDRGGRVLQLHELVPDQRPRRQVVPVEPNRAVEVLDRLQSRGAPGGDGRGWTGMDREADPNICIISRANLRVVASEGEVISDDAVGLGTEPVDAHRARGEAAELLALVVDIEDVRVHVEALERVRVRRVQTLEARRRRFVVAQVVARASLLQRGKKDEE